MVKMIIATTLSAAATLAAGGQCVPEFGPPEPFAQTIFYDAVASGDLNGDGLPEVIAASGGGVMLHRNTAGGFVFVEEFGYPFADVLHIGDINFDGFVDIAMVQSESSPAYFGIRVYLGDGTLSPGQPVVLEFAENWGSATQDNLVFEDLDLDGDLDIAFGDESGLLRVFRYGESGYEALEPIASPSVEQIHVIRAGHLRSFSEVDLVAYVTIGGGPQGDRVHFFEGSGDGTFKAGTDRGWIQLEMGSQRTLALVDLVDDGRKEVIVHKSPNGPDRFQVFRVEPDGTWSSSGVGDGISGPTDDIFAVGQFSLDRQLDLVGDSGTLYRRVGTLEFEPAAQLPWVIQNTLIVDLDGDGDVDTLRPGFVTFNQCVVDSMADGACCLPQGGCIVTSVEECFAAGGSWAGPNTNCGDVECPERCIGDVNFDGAVDVVDLITLLSAWGDCL